MTNDLPFAVVRASGKRWLYECGPARVMKVEKTTDANLIGALLNEDGSEVDSWDGYDVRPARDRRGYGSNSHWVTTRPGRVEVARLIARFATREEAANALRAMQAAWEGISADCLEEARDALSAAMEAERAARQAAEDELREKMRPYVEAKYAAQSARARAEHDLFERRLAAAKAACAPCDQRPQGEDPKGLRAKPASAVPEEQAPQSSPSPNTQEG